MKLLTIGFEYDGNFHYALIRQKENNGSHHYQVTVMNGRLEQLLYGNHIINEVNGMIVLDDAGNDEQQKALKKQIAFALSQHLEKPIMSGKPQASSN